MRGNVAPLERLAVRALAVTLIAAAWLLVLHAVVTLAFGQGAIPGPGPQAANLALDKYLGWTISEVRVRGVTPNDEAKIRAMLAVKVGEPLDRDKFRESIQILFATGRFSDIQPEAEPGSAHDIALSFGTMPNFFVGQINVEGAPARPTENQIINVSKLQLGELLTPEKMERGRKRIREIMEESGYYRSKIEDQEQQDPVTQQVSILFKISPGDRAHVGAVNLTGSLTPSVSEDIREAVGMHPADEVSSDLQTRALQRLRKRYRKNDRLLSQITVERNYRADRNLVDYTFAVDPGPVVQIAVDGAHLRRGLIKRYVPVYEENALDDDLLNEGRRNILDHLQTQGFFEAKVGIKKVSPSKDLLRVIYVADLGPRHKLVRIAISGNKYFADDLLRTRMQVQPAGRLLSHGRFSQSLLTSDVRGLEELYRANGFAQIKITPSVLDDYQGENQLAVKLQVSEGTQTLVGVLHIVGNSTVPVDELRPLLSTAEGQPFSDFNVSTDRDAILNEYFNRGFPNATFEASAKASPDQPQRMDVTFTVHEGEQIFVDQVFVSGLNYTRPFIVQNQLQVRAGQPVSQIEMLDTQRRLYDLGVFNQVDTAVQNPDGKEPQKNVLVNVREAKRYTFKYGAGFEVQTGTGTSAPQGKTGVSPRVSFEVTRLNFRGRDHTLSFKSHVGRLQQRVLMSYDAPRWFNKDNLRLTFTAFYDNTLDVNTFTSRRLQGTVEAEQELNKASKMYYRFSYRRVQATNFAGNFNPSEAPLLSQPTRVGMPGFTYIRDKRDNPLESTKGNYNTFDAGVAASAFGSEADFSRVLLQNSTYHRIKKKYVFARSTRIGLETPFRKTIILTPLESSAVSNDCKTATEPTPSCPQEIPLPERFFSGGGNSLRGFGLNQAGPRDLFSGFPTGGSGLFINNLELRFPPPTLPFFQDNISFAIFHDAGNVFDTGHDMLHGLLRWHQKNPDLCLQDTADHSCEFNYTSHAVGVGVRYKTPVGPVRFDFGYNMNPPAFPSCQATPAFTGETASTFCVAHSQPNQPIPFFKSQHLGHFNIYFSIGQTF